ncbi:hypothetical protein Tco_1293363 [Tanacetum coccineum]
MLQMCPKLPGQKFVDPPFEEEILTFMRELGYSENFKLLSDVKVEILPQPWRTFGTIINKCLSGKVTGIDTLRLSQVQILWGLYHQKKVDCVYLLWEDLVFQIENKESKKNKYMFYPRFTKVIINHFMSQDQSIPRRNKVDSHIANDDPILTTMRFIPQHEVVQKYGAILPNNLITQAMKESEAYKTYYAFATRKAIPNPKYVLPPVKDSKLLLKRLDQMKLAIERSKTQLHSSQPSGSGAHEGTGVTPGVPDVPKYGSDEEQISWKSSNEEDDDDEENIAKDKDDDDQDDDDNTDHDDDDDERTESDNDGDDFVHPKPTTHDEEDRHDEEDKEEDSFDPKVQTPSHVESTDDEDSDEEIQSENVEGVEQDEEETNKEVEANDLYRDVNINLIKSLKDNFLKFKQTNQFAEAISTIPGIVDAYLANKMHEAIKTAVKLQSDKLKDEAQAENEDFINKPDENIMKIIKDQVNVQVKKQVTKLLPKIEKTVNEQLEAEILTRPSSESKSSHAIAANLSELELKRILIDKMESNKSIHRSNEQKNLYKALVDAYETDKLILDTYRDTVTFKRRRDDEDKDEEPSARSNRGSKRRRAGKEPESTSASKEKTPKSTGKSTEGSKSLPKSAGKSAHAEEQMHTAKDTEDQPHKDTSQLPDWF